MTEPRASARPGRRAPARPDGRAAGRTTIGVALAIALVALAVACGPQPVPIEPPNPAGLRTNLVPGGIELTWTATIDGQAHGYQLQSKTATGPWLDVPTSTNAATFTDVEPRSTYLFRVRSRAAPGATPTEFSPLVQAVYVEPTLPIVRITTDGFAPVLNKDDYVHGAMTIDPNGSDVAAYSGTLGIKGRGNSTWGFPKKPYRLKLDTKSPIMGIASNKDWVLLANYLDKSQLRTWAASQISEATDLDWTPQYRFVEVVFNGQYQGVYQLTEAIKPGSNRVDIEEMEPEDNEGLAVTGGYLMELDARLEENHEPGWRTSRQIPVVVKEPDPMTPQQRNYIQGFVQGFEDALFSPGYRDPVTGYASRLDVDSFIDNWIVLELTRNGDAYWSSTYFSKDRGEDQLVFGPVWDFDHSMGSTASTRQLPPEGWFARDNSIWVRRLFTDPAFVQRAEDRWAAFAPAFAALPAQIEALGESLRPAIDNDAARWSYTLGPSDEPAFVSSWLSTRIDWITGAFAAEG